MISALCVFRVSFKISNDLLEHLMCCRYSELHSGLQEYLRLLIGSS
ncbi:MAG: hypothetical protein ACJA0W_003519 [Candidatus Azotimanducaceae bacterium]|jgi:hypothetical protein